MNTLLLVALTLLAFPGCVVREPTTGARTPGQVAAIVRHAAWWQPAWWLLRLVIGAPVSAGWWAGRTALYWAARAIAAGCVRVASVAAADGRKVRIYLPADRMEVRA